MTSFDGLAKNIHNITVGKGFWDGFSEIDSFPFYAYKLAMVHSEVTEVLEAIRKDKGEKEVVLEIADVLIRMLDLFEGLKVNEEISSTISLDQVLADKVVVNQGRPKKHGVRG